MKFTGQIFSDQIFEAVIVDINHAQGTCTISPIEANANSNISEVPIPHLAGNGNSGIFQGINIGTRVIAAFTSAKSRDVTVILNLLPKTNMFFDNFQENRPIELPSGTYPYPTLNPNDVYIRGDLGAEIQVSGKGNVISKTVNGGGVYLNKNQERTSLSLISEDQLNFSNAGKVVSGTVRRNNGAIKNLFPKPDITEVPLFSDPEFSQKTNPIGFFNGSSVMKRSIGSRKRNPEISEYRFVINEFTTDSMFTGFDDEVLRFTNDIKLFDLSDTDIRNRDVSNSLHMAEHELVEIIGGNVVDYTGNILDINYNPLRYGDQGNKTPKSELELAYDKARRISRRGIGYHFQLSTNTKSDQNSETKNNFVFDIDKEGMIKLNIPASSDTGNIPFVSNSLLNSGIKIETEFSNKSVDEPIPVTLRDANGEVVFPNKKSQGFGGGFRKTGIRFTNGEQEPYFNIDSQEIRVNPTKHHNMYAAAERLIANTIRYTNIPQKFVNDSGFPEGLAVAKPFEVPTPSSFLLDEGNSLQSLRDVLPVGSTDFPTYMSVVVVEPGPSAIYSGGDTLIAGQVYADERYYPPLSNSFTNKISGNEISAEIGTQEDRYAVVGGKSANINMDGSLELSIGKDHVDNKSILLDTAGSMVAWFGKDINNRSSIIQTDGDFLLNVGGSYTGTGINQVMNKGRFEIRVNVTDKKFVTTKFSNQTNDPNVGAESDYIISISEDGGLIIAGMKKGAPMILRNDGPVLVESTSSDVTLKGIQVKTVDAKGVINMVSPPTRN